MKPVMCMVKDDPANGSYGDCVRACVASILELEADEVPHFFESGDGDIAFAAMRGFLIEHRMIPAYFPIEANRPLEWVLEYMNDKYHHSSYMLFCRSGDADHCVVGYNDKIVHNPAWYKSPIDGPHSEGVWIVIILARF